MKKTRLKMEQIWMSTAHMLARRSQCSKLSVGCVVTTSNLRHVLGNGYNGGPKKSNYVCRKKTCFCLHSEDSALIDAGSSHSDKVIFVTVFPCRQCIYRIINSEVSAIYYSNEYKKRSHHWKDYRESLKLLKEKNIRIKKI